MLLTVGAACTAHGATAQPAIEIVGRAELFAPGIVSTELSEIRLTISPDGRTALWFSRDRPGGPGAYDIWMSKRTGEGWSRAIPVPFNSPHREFDPAFSADGSHVYFSSDRPGGVGGDDLYRVAVTAQGFGEPEHLGTEVNSVGNEWAPMLSPDGTRLLLSSNGRGGAGRFDLFAAHMREDGRFETAAPLPGDVNTDADEFDATYLSDGVTVVFTRARDLKVDTARLYLASVRGGSYDAGAPLPESVNRKEADAYAPMLDWSHRDRITFSSPGQDARAGGTDVYVVKYRWTRGIPK